MPITYRIPKGSPLTAAELDDNFRTLESRLKTLEDEPIRALSLTQQGLDVRLMTPSGQAVGAFKLPMPALSPKGHWMAATVYKVGDVTQHGNALFYCTAPHTAGPTIEAAHWVKLFEMTGVSHG